MSTFRSSSAAVLLFVGACVAPAANTRREEPAPATEQSGSGLNANDGAQPASSGKSKPKASDVSDPSAR